MRSISEPTGSDQFSSQPADHSLAPPQQLAAVQMTAQTAKPPKVLAAGYDHSVMDTLTKTLGLAWHDTLYGPQISRLDGALANRSDGFALLSEYGVIELEGPDSFTFLQGQITNDVLSLADGQSCLAAYCNAKGRTLANFWVIRHSAEKLFLLPARTLAASLARRLSMFVLRAKTKVLNKTPDFAVLGFFAGAEIPSLTVDNVGEPTAPSLRVLLKDQRQLIVLQVASLAAWFQSDSSVMQKLTSSTAWRYADCMDGLPFICENTSELFVPQMINFELIGGVSFKKGCYPGQEIVARSHYLGKNKRRMLLGSVASELTPGSDVFSQVGGEPIGQVVMSAMGSDGRALVLFETNLQQANEASALACENQSITLNTLPYDVFGKAEA
jgi:tRNA-modifying protein YgfZ